MKKISKVILITTVVFVVYFVLDALYFNRLRTELFRITSHIGISHLIAYTLSGLPLYLAIILLHKEKSIKSIGLDKSFFRGIIVTSVFTLPMFLGFMFLYSFNPKITFDEILIGCVTAAFFEELFFRGFLFGQLFRYTKLGFLPSVIIGSLLFASMHLYQSREFETLAGIFAITFLGSILFAWLYAEWNYNLWIPIFLHLFMNLAWSLFEVSDNALGDIYANIIRFCTIFLAIFLTILYKRKRENKFEVNKKTIWMKKNENLATFSKTR